MHCLALVMSLTPVCSRSCFLAWYGWVAPGNFLEVSAKQGTAVEESLDLIKTIGCAAGAGCWCWVVIQCSVHACITAGPRCGGFDFDLSSFRPFLFYPRRSGDSPSENIFASLYVCPCVSWLGDMCGGRSSDTSARIRVTRLTRIPRPAFVNHTTRDRLMGSSSDSLSATPPSADPAPATTGASSSGGSSTRTAVAMRLVV